MRSWSISYQPPGNKFPHTYSILVRTIVLIIIAPRDPSYEISKEDISPLQGCRTQHVLHVSVTCLIGLFQVYIPTLSATLTMICT